MQRRQFLRTTAGAGFVVGAGTAGWVIGRQSADEDPQALERDDATGLSTGGAGALGVHRFIYSVPVSGPYVAITFDDGPDPQFTPRVLEILAAYGIKATFMVMGYNAVNHADLLKDVVSAGHEVGNHTWTHRDLSTVGPVETRYEIRKAREVIEEITGLKVRFFRPPRGEMNGLAIRTVAEEGNDILMWSVTGSVAGSERPEEVDRFVLSHVEPGAIIDYHDGIGRGTFNRDSAPAASLIERRTAEIDGLPRMLETAIGRGFQFMSAGDLLEREVPGLAPTGSPDTPNDPEAGEPAITNPPDATMPRGG